MQVIPLASVRNLKFKDQIKHEILRMVKDKELETIEVAGDDKDDTSYM